MNVIVIGVMMRVCLIVYNLYVIDRFYTLKLFNYIHFLYKTETENKRMKIWREKYGPATNKAKSDDDDIEILNNTSPQQ